MKTTNLLAGAVALAALMTGPASAHDQPDGGPGMTADCPMMMAAADMTDQDKMGQMGGAPAAAQPIQATGIIKGVDLAKHSVTLAHDPIPAIGWPAMNMAFSTAPEVDLKGVTAGQKVDFTLKKEGGGYIVTTVKPRK